MRLGRWLLAAVAVGLAACVAFWLATRPAVVSASALPAHTPNLDNGRTMFFAGGCPSCHVPPDQEDRTRLGGGRALASAFGTFYTPNISSDPDDGIGRWSEADFVTAMWKGASPKGEHYFPSFPYTSYQRMRLDDVRDLFAFLKTLPPVQGRAGPHAMSFPFNLRFLLGGWKFLFLDGEPFRPDPAQSAAWNRGAYLVNGPAHCAECHSPRNALGAIKPDQRFAGGPHPAGDGWIPNITQKGIGEWSVGEIAYLLETGDVPSGDSVGGEMVAVIRNISQLSAQDRNAMALYLKSLPPKDGPAKPAK